MARSKTELEQISDVRDLMREQEPAALVRARADSRKMSATWVAKSDFLVLHVVDATSSMKPKTKTYTCRVLEVEET